jgi:hypothetical protein
MLINTRRILTKAEGMLAIQDNNLSELTTIWNNYILEETDMGEKYNIMISLLSTAESSPHYDAICKILTVGNHSLYKFYVGDKIFRNNWDSSKYPEIETFINDDYPDLPDRERQLLAVRKITFYSHKRDFNNLRKAVAELKSIEGKNL